MKWIRMAYMFVFLGDYIWVDGGNGTTINTVDMCLQRFQQSHKSRFNFVYRL
jgi:hypothetical protein